MTLSNEAYGSPRSEKIYNRYHRRDIDGLRAIAVLAVVLFHAGVPGFSGGFVGVDVFFVISGFVICRIIRREIEQETFSLRKFYERRARRILPALIFLIFCCFLFGWVVFLNDQFLAFSKSAIAAVSFTSNIYFWRHARDYFAPTAEFAPLLHTWSLAVEGQFYLFFPLFVVAISRWAGQLKAAIISIFLITSLALSVYGVASKQAATFYLVHSRAWELLIGALIAFGPPQRQYPRIYREVLSLIGLLLIVSATSLYHAEVPFPGIAAVVPCLGALFVIAAGNYGTTCVGQFLSLKPLVLVGLASYSLYLWHWPILAFLRLRIGSVILSTELAVSAIVLSLIAASLSWILIERPFRRPDFFAGRKLLAPLGASIAISVVASLTVWVGDGFPNRIPIKDRQIANAAEDQNPRMDECLDVWPEKVVCIIGEPLKEAEFLAWGDSHADALAPAIDIAAKKSGSGGLFAATVGCPPLMGVTTQYAPQCNEFNDAVLAMLSEREDLRFVILVARWAFYAEGARSPGEPGTSPILAAADDLPAVSGDNFAIFEKAFTRTIATLREMNRTVVILEGIPEIGWNVPAKLASASRWGDKVPMAPNIDDVSKRNIRVQQVFNQATRDPGVILLPIADELCRPDCIVEHDGKPLYYDDDHISFHGAKSVIAPALVDLFKPIKLNAQKTLIDR